MDSKANSQLPEDDMQDSCRLPVHSLQGGPPSESDAVSVKRLREQTDVHSNPSVTVPALVASDSGEPLSHVEESLSKRRKIGEEGVASDLRQGSEAEPCSMMETGNPSIDVPARSSAKGAFDSETEAAPVNSEREGAPLNNERVAMQQEEGKGGQGPIHSFGDVAREGHKEGAGASCGPEREAGTVERPELGGSGVYQELMHVLAVDDSPVDRKLVERLLKDVPYKVTTAESGVHALGVLGLDQSKATHERGEGSERVPPNFDLIMTDYSMPGLNGYQLLQRLKREETGLERVPVVIMSSDKFPKRVAKCIEGGAEDYLHKPVQAADINRIKAQILSRKGSDELRSPSSSKDEPGFPGSPPRSQEPGSKPGSKPS